MMKDPKKAAKYLRDQEQRRLREIRAISLLAYNGIPVTIDQLVKGGHLPYPDAPSTEGVIVSTKGRNHKDEVYRAKLSGTLL